MHVGSIWQYPVKSMIGSEVTSGVLEPLGMAGDRVWAVRDEVRGSIQGARRIAGLMQLAAEGDAAGVTITLPNGSTVHSAADDVNARLSAALDHPVSLWPLPSADNLDYFRRSPGSPDTDVIADLRGIFGREGDEPLPDFGVFPPTIMEFESPPGSHVDCYPLMLMTTSAQQALADALPDSNTDIRRFRPNLIIDSGEAAGHPEFDWVGRELRIGATRLQIPAACPRCVMITREVAPGVPTDRAILRHVVRDLHQNVGVYANVIEGGTINVGDPVELL